MRRLSNLFFLFILTCSIAKHVSANLKSAKPNIILILIDDQDMDEMSVYGGKVYTPNMDKLASKGIRFNNAYASSTVCTPSRYSFLTGRYAGKSYSGIYESEVGKSGQGFPGFNVALENDRMNVARVLHDAGYVTGFTGKYHLMSKYDQPEMFEGDDSFIDGYGEDNKNTVLPGDEISKIFAHNEAWGRKYLKNIGFDWAKNIYESNLAKPYDAHNPEWNTSAVFEFLEENKNKTFFLQCCPTLLHGPDQQWVRSFNYPDYTGAGEIKASPSVMEKRRELKAMLRGMGYNPESGDWGIVWINALLRDIMNKLTELKIEDNTLLIFTPDHGSSDKASLFNINGAQIPLIMKWPAGISPQTKCELLVQNIDLAPTYFELAGAKIPANYRLDGQSLVPLFKTGKTDKWKDHLYLELGNARAVVTNDYKYITTRYPEEVIKRIKNASPESLPKLMSPLQRLGIGIRGASHPGFWDEDQLYDLKQDPLEMKNMAYDTGHSGILDQMKKLLDGYLKAVGRPFGEFISSGNAALPGQVNKEIEIVKQFEVNGEKIVIPKKQKNRK